jgi:hypothetical protein
MTEIHVTHVTCPSPFWCGKMHPTQRHGTTPSEIIKTSQAGAPQAAVAGKVKKCL